jgi:glutamate/tyrosine decarboxylase-like PLP-dependent enzyme
MTLDLMHASAVEKSKKPCAAITSGGTESILSALLVYREIGRQQGITDPEVILPITAHPAFEKGAWLFGIKVIPAPIDPATTLVDVDFVRAHISDRTVALVGSAGNYAYGTVDPIDQLSELAVAKNIGLHVDGCLGGFILPFGEELGYDIPVFDFRLPGVTSISADTHKFGFALKGSSVVVYRDRSMRRHQYFTSESWPGGKYHSPGIPGSRSVGLLAATWAAMVSLGREGYLRQAKAIFETSYAMQAVVRQHPELRLLGNPSFCFSFTSDAFDIYHVNDFMKRRGWRFNGQQYPNAIHLCVTKPQSQPGVVEAFAEDLAAAVAYGRENADKIPVSAAIYGGLPGGDQPGMRGFVKEALCALMDTTLDVPQDSR